MYLNQLDMPTLQWEKACNMFLYILNSCSNKVLKRRNSHEKGLQLVTWKSLSHNISLHPSYEESKLDARSKKGGLWTISMMLRPTKYSFLDVYL